MGLYKNKWETKTWAELSASVSDASNSLVFRPKERLPFDLQQGTKASKNASGWFNRESIEKTVNGAYDNGFYIYDTGSNLSYTGITKTAFKNDITEFLNSSSLSSAAKAQMSSSFNSVNFPSIVVQIDSGSLGSVATASFTTPAAVIASGSQTVDFVNASTNTTNIVLDAPTSVLVTGSIFSINFDLPMETIKFTPTYGPVSYSLAFASFTGSEYSSSLYESSSYYVPHASAASTASPIGKIFGSGSLVSYASGGYEGAEHGVRLKALGDGLDATYAFSPKTNTIVFTSSVVIVTQSYKVYGVADTSKNGSHVTRTFHFVSGSTSNYGPGIYHGTLGQASGSHIFSAHNGNILSAAGAGIYVPNDGSTATGYLAVAPVAPDQVPQFTGQTY